MNAPALRGFLAGAVLGLQPEVELQDDLRFALVLAAESASSRPRLSHCCDHCTVCSLHREEAADNLGHAVRRVASLEGCQVQAPSEQLLHLILQELVVRRGPLEGSHREEDAREADLPHEIHETVVHAFSVQRREAVARHEPLCAGSSCPRGPSRGSGLRRTAGARCWICSRGSGDCSFDRKLRFVLKRASVSSWFSPSLSFTKRPPKR